jgi:hypothetical protein
MTSVRSQPFPPRRRRRTTTRRATVRRPVVATGAGVAGASDQPGQAELADDNLMSHEQLLALARSVQAAAIADDLTELSRSVQRLRRGLRHHVEVERARAANLASPLRAVVFGGQDRLMRLVDALCRDVDGDRECACVRRTAELVVALTRQATLEAAALLRPIMTPEGEGSPKLS